MSCPLEKSLVMEILKAVLPALIILFATFVISVFFREFTFVSGTKAAWLIILRFSLLTLVLLSPLLFLPQLFALTSRFFPQGVRELVQLRQERHQEITPLKNWLSRPLQGIGVSMLIATKLIYLLEMYSSSAIDASVITPPQVFDPWRFLTITAMAVTVAAVLSYLWSFDDLGIRIHNRKTKEIRMMGRYVGLILPVFLGFYGMISLSRGHSMMITIEYLVQLTIVLYPPFVVFNVLHAFFLRKNEHSLLERLRAKEQPDL